MPNNNEKESLSDLESLIPSNPNIGRKRRKPKSDKTDSDKSRKNTKNTKKTKKTEKQKLEGISSQKMSEDFLEEENEVEYYEFGKDGSKIDPFRDALSLTYYYRYYLTVYSEKKPNFTLYNYDVIQAGKILDDLKKYGKKGNLEFLKGWIRYYIESHLKSNRINNINFTSMDKFHKTLSKYKNIAFLD